MTKLAYKINFLNSQSEEGQADRIVFNDERSILNLGPDHAPLYSLLENGVVVCSNGPESKRYEYQFGLVRIQNNQCVVTVLR